MPTEESLGSATIGAIDPNLLTPVFYNFSANVERKIARDT